MSRNNPKRICSERGEESRDILDVRQRFCYRLRKKRVSHKDERVQNITCLAIKIKKKTLRGKK